MTDDRMTYVSASSIFHIRIFSLLGLQKPMGIISYVHVGLISSLSLLFTYQ
jgi:hypothetical protein